MTFDSVVRREGISQQGHATAAPFLGSIAPSGTDQVKS
jgi:hypothetical protein